MQLPHLDATSKTPPFDQIRSHVAAQVESRALMPGDKLPTVRALAEQLGLAVNTVARAYRELEQDGVVETRGRAGTFVTGDGRDRAAKAAAREYVDRVRALGLSDAEARQLVERLLS